MVKKGIIWGMEGGRVDELKEKSPSATGEDWRSGREKE